MVPPVEAPVLSEDTLAGAQVAFMEQQMDQKASPGKPQSGSGEPGLRPELGGAAQLFRRTSGDVHATVVLLRPQLQTEGGVSSR